MQMEGTVLPFEVFTAIEQHHNLHFNQQSTFFSDQFNAYQNGYQVNPDVSLLGFTTNNIAVESRKTSAICNQTPSRPDASNHSKKWKKLEQTLAVSNVVTVKHAKIKTITKPPASKRSRARQIDRIQHQ